MVLVLIVVIGVLVTVFWAVPRAVDKTLERVVLPWMKTQIIESEGRVRELIKQRDAASTRTHTRLAEGMNEIHDVLDAYHKLFRELRDDVDLLCSQDEVPMPTQAKVAYQPSAKQLAQIEEVVESFNSAPNLKPVECGLPLHGHTLLVGQNGSGKSNVLMMAVIERWQKGEQMYLIDTKGELVQLFGNIIPAKNIIDDLKDVPKLVKTLLDVGKVRRDQFTAEALKRKEPVLDYQEYEQVTGNRMKRITLFVEELVVVAETLGADQFNKMFVMLRSAGIFVFAVSQRLKANILPTEASTNIVNKVFLGPADTLQFKSMFPEGLPTAILNEAKTTLGPPGFALVYAKNEYQFKQFDRVSRDLLREIMRL